MGQTARDTSHKVAPLIIGVRDRTYFMVVTLETSHPPMSWSNDEAPTNMELYVAHPTATQTHTRDIQETHKRRTIYMLKHQHRSQASRPRRSLAHNETCGGSQVGQERAKRGKYASDRHA